MVYLRKLMSNAFFLKYFVINYDLNFMYIYNVQWKFSPKWKYYDIVHAINFTHKLTWVFACTSACNCMCLREQYVNFWKVIYENVKKNNNIHFITNISILYGSQTYWSFMKFYFVFKKQLLCLYSSIYI